MPSPVEDHPGLLIRDPFRYSPAIVVVPPPLVPCLALFDGAHEEDDLRRALEELTGEADVAPLLERLRVTLSDAGFLDDAPFADLRDARRRAFAGEPARRAAHEGTAYPGDPAELRALLDGYLRDCGEADPPPPGRLVGIAAPHVSPEGGWRSYGAAYRHLAAAAGPDRTFVVLATSHYGQPGTFGLTRKPYATALGATTTDVALVDRLAASGGPAVSIEDYCHSFEHSAEFQVVFLQHAFGGGVRVVPVLCGPLAPSSSPDAAAAAEGFLAGLRDATAGRDDVVFVLGVDMAHVGRRYGDRLATRAGDAVMSRVEALDRQRCALLARADREGFREALGQGDPLKWCGSSAFYAFLNVAGPVRGSLLRYEQWNIDDASVVSFGAFAFHSS
jgi:AmmeMemoRadiSam system protein B